MTKSEAQAIDDGREVFLAFIGDTNVSRQMATQIFARYKNIPYDEAKEYLRKYENTLNHIIAENRPQ